MNKRRAHTRYRPVKRWQQPEKPLEYGPVSTGCPVVENAIDRLYEAGPDKGMERFWGLIASLNYAIQLETRVLVPMEMALGVFGSGAPWAKHPIPHEKADGLRYWHVFTESGKCYLPLFTNTTAADASRATAGRPVTESPLAEAMEYALSNDALNGVVINPWGHSATLDNSLLRGLLHAEDAEDDPGDAEARDGFAAAGEGDWERAVGLFREAWAFGCPAGARGLAEAAFTGNGLPKSRPTAMRFWRKGAEAGDILSMLMLGDRYAEGTRTRPGSPGQALLYYRQAQTMFLHQPDITTGPLLQLRLAEYEMRHISLHDAQVMVAEARQGFAVLRAAGMPHAAALEAEAKALALELAAENKPDTAYNTDSLHLR